MGRNILAFAAPSLFGVLVASVSVVYLLAKENFTSKANVHIVPTPEVQQSLPIAGYPGRYAAIDYVIRVEGEDVQFDSLDGEFRHQNGDLVTGTRIVKSRILDGGFKVRAGERYDFWDNINTLPACEKMLPVDGGQLIADYTFNAIDMHRIPLFIHALVRVVC